MKEKHKKQQKKKKQRQKGARGTEAIAKGWELNDFVVHLNYLFKHLHSTATCFDLCNSLCFKIIDKANSKFDLKIKKAL